MFSTKIKTLKEALTCLGRFAVNKLYIPAIILETENGELYMKSSSQDKGYAKIKVETEETITRSFKVAAPYNLLSSAIAKLALVDADMEVSMNITENNLVLKTDKIEVKIATLPAENVLDVDEPNNFVFGFEIPKDTFIETINEILPTLHWNNTTPLLDGIIIERLNRRLCFQAVSPYKISYRWLKTEEDYNAHATMTIPRKIAIDMLAVLNAQKSTDDDKIAVMKSDNNIAVIQCDKVTMGIRLMQTPPLTATKALERLNVTERKTIEVDAGEFLNAVEIGSITASINPKIKISVDANNNTVTIQSENNPNDTGTPIAGSSRCVIGCRVISMPEERLSVRFNPELVKGRVFRKEEIIKLHFAGQNNNILITGKGYIEMIAPCL